MRLTLIGLTVFCGALLVGCHSEPAADDSAAGRLVTGKRISEPEERQAVGSWPMNMIATPDGRFGFILDRTASPPRIRLDGDRYVLALSPLQASKGWLEYTAGGIWMRLDEETGRILSVSFSGLKDATRVVRDGDAKPLPPP